MPVMSGGVVDDELQRLRTEGRWALYWEVLHARGGSTAVSAAVAALTPAEREPARAGLERAAAARRQRTSARLSARSATRCDEPTDVVLDVRAAAIDLATSRLR